jgi:hypothetical protein
MPTDICSGLPWAEGMQSGMHGKGVQSMGHPVGNRPTGKMTSKAAGRGIGRFAIATGKFTWIKRIHRIRRQNEQTDKTL